MARRASALLRWIVVAVVLVLVAGVGLGAYAWMRPTVVVTEVVEGPVVEAFYATGTLQAAREYPVKSNAAGIVARASTTHPFVDKGDPVSEGQPLAFIADPALQLAYDKALAELDEKRHRADEHSSPVLTELDAKIQADTELLELAKRENDRVDKLRETGGASQSDFDKALDRVKTLWGDLESAKAQKDQSKLRLKQEVAVGEAALAAAKANLGLQTVRSPIDGVVLDRPVSVGSRLAVNDHLLLVADVRPDKLVMRAQVDEEDITGVQLGQTVRMVLYSFPRGPTTSRSQQKSPGRPNDDDRSFTATVTKIYPKADPDRRTFEVDVTPNQADPQFAAGMTGELAFELKAKASAVIVPSQALQGGKVYLVRNGRLRATEVNVGLKGVERTELLTGVRPGDRVLISPAKDLHDGQAVREHFMEPRAAAAMNKPKEKEIFRGGF